MHRRQLEQTAPSPASTLTAAQSIPALQVLKPNEAPSGTGIPFLNLTYRVVGPEVLPVTSRLEQALQRSFASVFSLFQFPVDVVSVTPVTAVPATIVPAAALNGNSTARMATRKLLQGRLNTSPAAESDYAAADANVIVYVTQASVFEALGQRRQVQQIQSLSQSLTTFGYEATFMPQTSGIINNTLILTSRLPQSFQDFDSSTFIVNVQLSGHNIAPATVEAQTALQKAVTGASPDYIYGSLLAINRTADLSAAAATLMITTAAPNGTYAPTALAAVVDPAVQAYIKDSGASGAVRVTAAFAQLPAFQYNPAIAKETAKAVPLPGDATAASSGAGLGTGGIIGIVIGTIAGLAITAVIIAVLVLRHRRKFKQHGDSGDERGVGAFDLRLQGWAIPHQDIEICKHPDGTEWLLGAGAYGRVYKALRGGVQDVAVKQLIHTGDGQLEQFISEVGILKGLNYDRNIVQFYGACIMDGQPPMLVTEFMEGGDLCSAIQADSRGDLLWYGLGHRIALDIARGLFFLHSHEVVHSDIKSRNVLLNGAMHAKISDVGLAQLIDARAERSKVLAWTLAYAAPEVLLDEVCSLKSDIYSFGMVLWEIVSGTTPSTRGKLQEPGCPQDCPQDIWQLIQECLAASPDSRPTAKECFARIQASCNALNLLATKSWGSPASHGGGYSGSQVSGHSHSTGDSLQAGELHESRRRSPDGRRRCADGRPDRSANAQHPPKGSQWAGGSGGRPQHDGGTAFTDSAGAEDAAMHSRSSSPPPPPNGQLPEDMQPREPSPPPNPFATALSSAWSGPLYEEQVAAARGNLGMESTRASPVNGVPPPPAPQQPQQQRTHAPQLLSVKAAAAQVAAARRLSFKGRRASFGSPDLRATKLPPPAHQPGMVNELQSASRLSDPVEDPVAGPAVNGAVSSLAGRQEGGKFGRSSADPYDAYAMFADESTDGNDVYAGFA